MKDLITLAADFVDEHPMPKGDFDFNDWMMDEIVPDLIPFLERMYSIIENA